MEPEPHSPNNTTSNYGLEASDHAETISMSSLFVDAEPTELVTALGVFDPDLVFASALDIDFPDQWWVDESDSAIGCPGHVESNSGMSLRSSIYGTVEENGRTYHRYKEGKYFLPNDDLELDRLDLQHALFKHTLHGKLYLAPIGPHPQRVLDICTGTGIWAIDFATLHPNTDVLGTDLSPVQPDFIPQNCRFEIDDAEDEWTFSHNFDFIHGRTLLSCFTDPAAVITKAFENLVPGGYLEFQDAIIPMRYVGNVPTDSALYKWNLYIVEASVKAQRPWTNVKNYPQFFRDAGFENVQEAKFLWPNHWQKKGKYLKVLSRFFHRNLSDGVEAMSMKLFTNFLGWSREDVLTFVAEVRKDLDDPSIQTYAQVSMVYGRKPKGVDAQSEAVPET